LFFKPFRYAFRGIHTAFKTGRNLCIMAACFIFVIAASFILGLSGVEWAVVLLCCAGVISLEMINSAIEALLNVISPEYQPQTKRAKDIAAGAVLVFSFLSLVAGLIIFVPHIIKFLGG
jgi:undecaprenol kinase